MSFLLTRHFFQVFFSWKAHKESVLFSVVDSSAGGYFLFFLLLARLFLKKFKFGGEVKWYHKFLSEVAIWITGDDYSINQSLEIFLLKINRPPQCVASLVLQLEMGLGSKEYQAWHSTFTLTPQNYFHDC